MFFLRCSFVVLAWFCPTNLSGSHVLCSFLVSTVFFASSSELCPLALFQNLTRPCKLAGKHHHVRWSNLNKHGTRVNCDRLEQKALQTTQMRCIRLRRAMACHPLQKHHKCGWQTILQQQTRAEPPFHVRSAKESYLHQQTTSFVTSCGVNANPYVLV